jgi:hypothetical protein
MTDANPTYPVPQNAEQEAALEKALATRVLQKLDEAKALFEGDAYGAFREGLEGLVALKLPPTSATAQNAGNLSRFLDTMQQGLAQDRAAADAIVNPPPPLPPVPMVPPTPIASQ